MNRSSVSWLASFILLVMTSSCVASPGEGSAVAETPVAQAFLPNYLVEAEGNIALRRTGWSGFSPIGFGTVLKPGDLIQVAAGGRAAVFCGDASLWLEGPFTFAADDQQHGIPCQSGMPPRPWPDVSALRGEQSEGIPYIISPRNTALLSATPVLRWKELAGVEQYTLSILSDDGQTRLPMIVNGQQSSWPQAWPPLEPMATYVLIVEGGGKFSDQGDPTHSGLGFWLMDAVQAQDVLKQTDQLSGLGLSAAAHQLLVAELYLKYQLRAESLQVLEEVAQTSNISAIWLNLGKTYLENKLPQEARQASDQALLIAQDKGELEAQALAHFGLALAYQAQNETGLAQEHFQHALAIFNQIGDQNQAAEVARYLKP